MKKLIAVLCLSLAFAVAAAPISALAGTRTLWPIQFSPATWKPSLATIESNVRRNFYWLGSTNTLPGVWYESEVRLPVGTRVTEFAVSASTVSQAVVEAVLMRARLGGDWEEVAKLNLAGAHDRAWYTTTGITHRLVEAGYRYWVDVYVFGDTAFVYGVRVSYR